MSFTIPQSNIETEEKVETTTATPAVKLDDKLKDEILSQIQVEGTVIVYCTYTALFDERIRIWNSTVLIDNLSGSRSRLLHALNISIAPVWMDVQGGSTARFTLIFAPLSNTCEAFELLEDIPQSGGFHIRGIIRNGSDVYNVEIV